MDTTKLSQIVRYSLGVAAQADERDERELGPIHLLKFVYLADLEHAQRNGGRTFTDAPWRFYHFGPWDEGAHAAIEMAADATGATRRQFDWGGTQEGIRWSIDDDHLADELLRAGDQLPREVTSAIRSAVRQYGADTYSLLDYVYLTPPMLSAAPGERLDFAPRPTPPAAPDSDESPRPSMSDVQPISKMEARRRRAAWVARRDALRERVAAGGSPRSRMVPPPIEPVYDESFQAGVAALDEMSGDPIPDVAGIVQFSPAIWKSRGRRESGVS